jgi:hypothetical protein
MAMRGPQEAAGAAAAATRIKVNPDTIPTVNNLVKLIFESFFINYS